MEYKTKQTEEDHLHACLHTQCYLASQLASGLYWTVLSHNIHVGDADFLDPHSLAFGLFGYLAKYCQIVNAKVTLLIVFWALAGTRQLWLTRWSNLIFRATISSMFSFSCSGCDSSLASGITSKLHIYSSHLSRSPLD